MALEVRAFNSKAKKTFLNEETNASYNLVVKIVLVLSLLLTIVWRIII